MKRNTLYLSLILASFLAKAQLTPTLLSPSNNKINVEIQPTFHWLLFKGCTLYQLRVTGPNSTIVLDTLVQDTVFSTPSFNALSVNTTYSWTVAARQGTSQDYAPSYNFTTLADLRPTVPIATYPKQKVLLSNTNSTTTNFAFNWNVVNTATSYHLQVSTSATFASFLVNDSTLTQPSKIYSNLSFTLGQTYHWRLRAKNSYGYGNFTTGIPFTIISNPPAQLEPKGTNIALTPTFKWNRSKNHTGYHLILQDTSSRAILVDTLLIPTDTSFIPMYPLMPDKNYLWKIAASYGEVESSFVSVFFRTLPTTGPLQPITSSKVSDGKSVQLVVYKPVNSTVTHYLAEWAVQKTFLTILKKDSVGGSESNYTSFKYADANLTVNKWFYVRVKAFNTIGASTYLIDSVYNKENIPNPEVPQKLLPLNQASNVLLTPVLTWHKGKAATSYRLVVKRLPDSTMVIDKDGIADTSYTVPAGTFAANTTYFWYIGAANSASTVFPSFITRFHFTTINATTAVPPVVLTPKDTVFSSQAEVRLDWEAVPNASSYCLQVSKDSLFTAPYINECGISQTYYVVPMLILTRLEQAFRLEAEKPVTSYWRIATTNIAGNGVWSARQSFVKNETVTSVESSDHTMLTSMAFPNPFTDVLVVNKSAENQWLRLKDLKGQLILANEGTSLNTATVPSGVYVLEIQSANGKPWLVKVVKH